ncbi:Lovastatin diketide synthase LovF [Orchesella cincta]|uniref:Lovastatin diketide synthase LovF n=1 Tax=Orchesella cincta TaxID=48709 RepID=A0A1D2MG63_ORCCI|nr:Lovastatin diketide synthase LovF [Orchesella cincta]
MGKNSQAWVTYVSDDEETVTKAVVLARSLKRVCSSGAIVVFAPPTLSKTTRGKLRDAFEMLLFTPLNGDEKEKEISLSSSSMIEFVEQVVVQALTLISFKKCILLPPDFLVLRNCDEIFENFEYFGMADDNESELSIFGGGLELDAAIISFIGKHPLDFEYDENESIPNGIVERIVAPLALSDLKACKVQTVAKLEEDTEVSYRVEVHRWLDEESESDTGGNGGKWIFHASGSFLPVLTLENEEKVRDIIEIQSAGQTKEWNASEMYEMVAELGLRFGPTFQSLQKGWLDEKEEGILFQVNMPRTQGQDEYMLHPLVGDAMLQAIMVWQRKLSGEGKRKRLQIPVRIGEFQWLSLLNNDEEAFIYCRAVDADISAVLLNRKGSMVARMSSVEFIETSSKFVLGMIQQQSVLMPGLWEEVAQKNPSALEGSVPSSILESAPRVTADAVKGCMEESRPSDDEILESSHVSQITTFYLVNSLLDLGWAPKIGERFTLSQLVSALSIKPKFKNYISFFLSKMVELKFISHSEENYVVEEKFRDIGEITGERLSEVVTANEHKRCDYRLVLEVGKNLKEILKGGMDPLFIMFPEEPDKPHVQGIYDHVAGELEPTISCANGIFSQSFPAIKRDSPENCVRVLEVGAGTGKYADRFFRTVVPQLEKEQLRLEYVFTDISPSFFSIAKEKLEEYSKYITFKRLDIEQDPFAQGFLPEYFDVVICGEVLHATKNIRDALTNVERLLKPGGTLQIGETIQEDPLMMFIFGLLDGYWRFKDNDEMRKNSPVLNEPQWKDVLEKCGFIDVTIAPIFNGVHAGIYAYRRTQPLLQESEKKFTHFWLVFGDNFSSNFVTGLSKRMKTIGRELFLIERVPDSSTTEVKMKKYIKEKIKAANIIRGEAKLEGVLYLWGMLEAEEHNQLLISLPFLYICQDILASHLEFPPNVFILTYGNDNPSSSTLFGLAKSISSEYTNLTGGLIVLERKEKILHQVEQVIQGSDEKYTLQPLPIERFDALDIRAALTHLQQAKQIGKIICVMPELGRENARLSTFTPLFNKTSTYIVTGGLGGIGFEVVKWMLKNGAKHIAIASRSSEPKPEIEKQLNSLNKSGNHSLTLLSKLLPTVKNYVDDASLLGEQHNQVAISTQEFWAEVDAAEGREEKLEIIKKHIKMFARNTLKMGADEPIGDFVDFQSLGIDSLMMLEMKNTLQNALGSRLIISASQLRDCNNVHLLANRLYDLMERKEEEGEMPSLEELRQLIHEDCKLCDDISIPTSPVKVGDIKVVLITGATGTLGSYILKNINKMEGIMRIYCLVRSTTSSVSAEERLKKILEKNDDDDQLFKEKLNVLDGDISKEYFGLEVEIYDKIASEVDAVIHFAVKSDHIAKYWKAPPDRHSNIRNVNVLGTKRVLQFAAHLKTKQVFFASSAIIILTTEGDQGYKTCLNEEWQEDDAFDCVNYNSGYTISKFVSEQLVQKKVLFFYLLCSCLQLCRCENSKPNSQPAPYALSSTYLINLAVTEVKVYALMAKYAEDLQERLKYMKDYEDSSIKATAHLPVDATEWEMATEIASHPIAAYRMVRRFATDFYAIGTHVNKKLELGLHNRLSTLAYGNPWPYKADHVDAMDAILRIHYVYDLNLKEFVRGNIMGIQTNVGFPPAQVFEIAEYATQAKYYSLALEWLNVAEFKMKDENHFKPFSASSAILAETRKQIIETHDLDFDKNITGSYINLFMFTEQLLKNPNAKTVRLQNYAKFKDSYGLLHYNFLAICNGKQFQTPSYKATLNCWYDKRHPYFYLFPLKTELLNHEPLLIQFHDIVGDEWIRIMKKAGMPTLERAPQDVSGATPRSAVYAWLQDEDIPSVPIGRRVELITGLHVRGRNASTDLQIASYAYGAMYLRMLIQYTALKNGEVDERMVHGACPIVMGHKWIATKWTHLNDNFLTRPCDLNPTT